LLDAILQEVSPETEKKSSAWWIDRLSKRHGDLIDRVLARLVSAGILRSEERRFLWVFSRRAYPQVSGREDREAKGRLMAVLFNDEVPEPRDALLLGLAKSTDVLAAILTEEQLDKAAPRIEEVASLEEISRSVGLVASEIRSAMVSIMMAHYP
jgi:golgi phosphoprotein 3